MALACTGGKLTLDEIAAEVNLKQFITDRLPTVEEDAAVFDLSEARSAKAQKFLQDNKLS